MKLKICSICKGEVYLWKSNPPTCKNCCKPKPLNKISKKHKETLKEYKPKREEFLKENPYCQLKLEGCTYYATCIEHRAGKATKKLYLDETKWFASCISCNLQIETLADRYEKNLKLKHNVS